MGRAPALLAAALLSCALAACGGGEATESAAPPAAGFKSKGADNSIAAFGREAPAAERLKAAAVLHAYLQAGLRRDWRAACRHLAPGLAAQVALTIAIRGEGCPRVLGAFFATVSPRRFERAAVARVGSFRVEGERGFLLYRGEGGVAYSMPMAREGERWAVGALAGSGLV